MDKGLFITFEGPDGSGKSTQINYVKEFLEENNIEAILTREPGGTDIGEKIRDIILDVRNKAMSEKTEAFLYAASRAQHVDEKIKPALMAGKIVICDRFVDSSIAYQGYGRGLGEWIGTINKYAIDECVPDVTFLMALDPKIGKSRIDAASFDRLETERLTFHRKVYQGYLAMAQAEPDRFVLLDGSEDRETIRRTIREVLIKILRSRGLECL